MPSRNEIGNKGMNHGKVFSNNSTISAKADKRLVSMIGNTAKHFKLIHEYRKKGDKFRISVAILIYCNHKHNHFSVSNLTKMYSMRTDQIRRILHSTKRMFDRWREDGDT